MSRPRQVRGLRYARLEPKGPFEKPTKLRGRAAEGIRYQNKVVDLLRPLERFGTFLHDQWVRYSDANGRHWCQLDALLETYDRVVIVEIKLSLRREETGITQLTKLYKPVASYIYGKPIVPLLVFKHWLGESELPLVSQPEILVYKPVTSAREPHGWHCFI